MAIQKAIGHDNYLITYCVNDQIDCRVQVRSSYIFSCPNSA